MSWNEPESNPRRSGLPTLMRPAKPLLPTRLTKSTESLAIDLVYVLQDERYASASWISCIFRVSSYVLDVNINLLSFSIHWFWQSIYEHVANKTEFKSQLYIGKACTSIPMKCREQTLTADLQCSCCRTDVHKSPEQDSLATAYILCTKVYCRRHHLVYLLECLCSQWL